MASVDLGKGYVQIVPSAQGISGKIEDEINPAATQAGKTAGSKIAAGIGGGLKTIGGGMIKAGAIATAISVPLIAGIKKSLDAYKVQSAAENKLTEIYEKRMGLTKEAAKSTIEYAGALQKQGVVGDEVTLSGAQQLATFASTNKTVETLLPSMQNLMVQQKGLDATTQDATNIANLMGKVLQGQTGALKRVGISFTEAEEKVLKYGTEEERAAMLSKVITNNVGEMNKKMLETPEGKIQQMKNAFGDLQEQLGSAFAPVLAQVANYISTNIIPKVEGFINFLKANPVLAKIVVGLTAVLAVGGPILMMLGTIISTVGAVVGAVSAPILGIVAAVVAVGAALAIAYAKVKPFRKAVNDTFKAILPIIKQLIPPIKALAKTLIDTFVSIAKTIGEAFAPVLQAALPLIKTWLNFVVNFIKTKINIIIAIIKFMLPIIKAIIQGIALVILTLINVIKKLYTFVKNTTKWIITTWRNMKTTVVAIFTAIKDGIKSRIQGALNIVRNVVGAIKSILHFSGIRGIISAVFNGVKNAILHPFQTVKNTISGIVNTIKGFFHFSVPTPHIPLPHFAITPAGWKIGDLLKGVKPHLGIKWYAEGGIVDGATLIGAGEKGAEAILPLKPFWNKLENMNTGANYNISVNVEAHDLKDLLTVDDFINMLKAAKAFA